MTALRTGTDVCRIFLTGFMGSGKTSVGQRLAARWGWRFLDMDRWVEARTGRSIPDLFAQGEATFRRYEAEALEALQAVHWVVVATGGGTVEIPGALERLRAWGVLLWLDVPWNEVLRRLDPAGRAERPLWSDPDEVYRRWVRRLPLYAQAHGRVWVEGPVEAWVDAVERLLRGVTLCCTP